MNSRNSFIHHLAWSLLCACLPALIFYEIYSIFWTEVSHPATRSMPVLWLVYSGLAICLLSLIAWSIRPVFGQLVFTIVAVFSSWSMKLAFMPQFFELSEPVKAAIVAIFTVLVFLSVRKLSRKGLWTPLGLSIALLFMFVAAPQLTSAGSLPKISSIAEQPEEPLGNQPLSTPRSEIFDLLRGVQFSDKPNFYVFLYDSLIPPEVADIFFGAGSTGYSSVLEKSFIRPSGVTAQNAVPSKRSIRSVMWLDTPPDRGFDYFNGKLDSPLPHLFRANGYQITTGYTTMYWGEEIGDYINEYLYLASAPPQLQETTLCIENGEGLSDKFRAFGICAALGPFSAMPSPSRIVAQIYAEPSIEKRPNEAWHRVVENHIRLSANSDMPQFTFLYTYTPIGHTKKTYDHNNESDRSEYITHFKGRSNLARLVLEDLVEVVKDADNDAVVIIAGDHGTWISRASDDLNFRIVDRNLVAIGLLKTENRCSRRHETEGFIPNKGDYHTISTSILSVVACLAEDPTIPVKLPTKSISRISNGISLEQFISENISTELQATLPNK